MATGPAPGSRVYFVDYLRASIVTLVILHHVSVVYAANTAFYYLEPATNGLAVIVLVLFQLLNQAWFMGLFFLVSGYFTPLSLDRKGPGRYLKDRMVRLGIPLLVFVFVLNPLTTYIGLSHMDPSLLAGRGITLPITWQDYPRFLGPGPLWFLVLLVIFDLGYVTWRVARGTRKTEADRPFPTYSAIVAFILLLAGTSYLVRIIDPLGTYVLFFPSLAYLPEYASFFMIGIAAARGDWLMKMPGPMAKRVFAVAVVATFTLFLLALRGGAGFLGGGTWSSALYALWDSTFAVGVSMILVTFFRRYLDSPKKPWEYVSRHSYTVYFIHIPILVTIAAVFLSLIHPGPLAKFVLAAVIVVPLTWAVAGLIRKIPYADRVL